MTKKRWIAASAVAAMLALSSHGAMAQMASGSDMSMSGGIDYSVLAKPHAYDYTSLRQAKAAGYSDSQIATMVKIADRSDMSLTEVLAAVQRGVTFPVLALNSNLRLYDAYNVGDTEAEIENYKTAYEHTGTSGLKMGGDMSTAPMAPPMAAPTTPPPTTMAPPVTPTPPAMAMAPMAGSSDIVETAMAAGDFKTLVRLVKAAGLVDTLKGPGPFTVFAPTDAAFKKLPKGTVKMLLADPDKLKKILTYHVLPAKVMAADAMAMTSPTSPPTVEGDTLQVTTADGKVMINGSATVVQADIECSNGVIHAIDTVLMPPGS
jgi:uncharacterized surface protein with fasciclin (FAS1) repeats